MRSILVISFSILGTYFTHIVSFYCEINITVKHTIRPSCGPSRFQNTNCKKMLYCIHAKCLEIKRSIWLYAVKQCASFHCQINLKKTTRQCMQNHVRFRFEKCNCKFATSWWQHESYQKSFQAHFCVPLRISLACSYCRLSLSKQIYGSSMHACAIVQHTVVMFLW